MVQRGVPLVADQEEVEAFAVTGGDIDHPAVHVQRSGRAGHRFDENRGNRGAAIGLDNALQVVGQFLGGGVATPRVLLQALHHDPVEVAAHQPDERGRLRMTAGGDAGSRRRGSRQGLAGTRPTATVDSVPLSGRGPCGQGSDGWSFATPDPLLSDP